MSTSSSTTESSSLTGKRFRIRSRRVGIFSWPSDLKLLCSNHKSKPTEDAPDAQSSDIVYLTLKEAAARGRTASMSSDLGASGSRRRTARRARPRRRCTSEPPMASKYSPKPSVGFSGAVDSLLLRNNPVPGRVRPRSRSPRPFRQSRPEPVSNS